MCASKSEVSQSCDTAELVDSRAVRRLREAQSVASRLTSLRRQAEAGNSEVQGEITHVTKHEHPAG